METLLHRLRDAQALAKLIGQAPTFLDAIRELPAIAKSAATVLIVGETGTGKELVARAIHYLSANAEFPFVAINCGSLPDSLIEDELFGHERGSFTDARLKRQGLIAQAERGTLFLDEVDTLAPKAQVDLLRVLQDKTFRPIGSSTEQRANVRMLAASNRRLDEVVRAAGFRADLYYRLCVFSIQLPRLRDRKEDVILLAEHFLQKHLPADKEGLGLTSAACDVLLSWDWPGNVRELENAVIRGIHLTKTNHIDVDDLRLGERASTPAPDPLVKLGRLDVLRNMKRAIVERFERDYLIRLMSEHNGNVSQAAIFAGKERRDLGKLLKKYQVNPKTFHSRSRLA